jgi:hypothetical protein
MVIMAEPKGGLGLPAPRRGAGGTLTQPATPAL